MASCAASSADSARQYLTSLLSQKGPNALPYSEDVQPAIIDHLVKLRQKFGGLGVEPAPFVHNNGPSVNLLNVEGTIPMTYNGVSYDTPVIIWLLESYPKVPPCVFVSPTKDMVIKRPHKHVDASGMVSLPYLHHWTSCSSNLTDLAHRLSSMFSQYPPLFSKLSSPSSHPQHNRGNAVKSSGALGNPNSYTSSPLSSRARPQMQQPSPSPNRAESPGPTSPAPPVTSSYGRTENHKADRMDNPTDVFRGNAIIALVERLEFDISEMRKTRNTDIDSLVTAQSKLKQKKDQMKHCMEQMQQEKEGLEQQLQIIYTNTEMLRSWLKMHTELFLDIEVDDAFKPCDPLSKQMLECESVDLALEDVFYSLDIAVQERSIPVDVYLKWVRSLAREQFFYRALSAKVQAAQQQIGISNMQALCG